MKRWHFGLLAGVAYLATLATFQPTIAQAPDPVAQLQDELKAAREDNAALTKELADAQERNTKLQQDTKGAVQLTPDEQQARLLRVRRQLVKEGESLIAPVCKEAGHSWVVLFRPNGSDPLLGCTD